MLIYLYISLFVWEMVLVGYLYYMLGENFVFFIKIWENVFIILFLELFYEN